MLSSLSDVNSLACHILMSAHNHKRCPRQYIYMRKPLFLYYFLLIATMTKTMFVNSQQLLFIILFTCEVITLHKINMIFLFLFVLSLIPTRSQQGSKALNSKLLFIIYNSQTRLHGQRSTQNSNQIILELYSTRSRYNQKDRTKKNNKDRSVIVIL